MLSNVTTSWNGRDDLNVLIQSALIFLFLLMKMNPWSSSRHFAFQRKEREVSLHCGSPSVHIFFLAAFTCSLSKALTTQRFMFGGKKFFIAHDTLSGNTGAYDSLMCAELEILVNRSTGGWDFSIHSKIFLFLEDSRRKNCCLNQSQV